jgi:hypothetical protein
MILGKSRHDGGGTWHLTIEKTFKPLQPQRLEITYSVTFSISKSIRHPFYNQVVPFAAQFVHELKKRKTL